MFERLKKAFGQADARPGPPVVADAVSEWAGTKGFAFTGDGAGRGFALSGKIGDKPWKLERCKSSRDYIRGEELRARAAIDLDDMIEIAQIEALLGALVAGTEQV